MSGDGGTPDRADALSVLARIQVHPGRRDEFLAVFTDLVAAAADEPGLLLYSAHTSRREPDLVWIVELYRDRAAFEHHLATEAYLRARPRIDELALSVDVSILSPAAGKGLPWPHPEDPAR